MMGHVLLLAMFLLASGPAASQSKVLSLNASQVPPFHTSDQQGMEDRLVRELYRRLGFEVQIRDVPAERGLRLLDEGYDDGMLARNPNMQQRYPNVVQFSESALTREYVVFTKTENFEPAGWDSLAPYHVGIVTGWKILERNIKNAASLSTASDGARLFQLLEEGRVQVVVFNRWGGLQLVNDLRLEGVRTLEPPLARRDVFFYLHKRHGDLAARASDELRRMKRDGTYDRIVAETLSPLAR